MGGHVHYNTPFPIYLASNKQAISSNNNTSPFLFGQDYVQRFEL